MLHCTPSQQIRHTHTHTHTHAGALIFLGKEKKKNGEGGEESGNFPQNTTITPLVGRIYKIVATNYCNSLRGHTLTYL